MVRVADRGASSIKPEVLAKYRRYANVCNKYAQDVVSGKIVAGRRAIQACQRHLDDLKRARTKGFPYKFDVVSAGRPCHFIERLPHVKGEWARVRVGESNNIKLEPWQVFITCAIFGWVHKKTGYRRFSEAYIKVARKNAKTTWAAGVGLYMLVADREVAPEIFSGATSKKQAMEVFKTARRMAKKAHKFAEHFDLDINIESIISLRDEGKFEPLIGDPGDGASPSCAIVDEFHEHLTSNLHDTMVSGMGARRQGLCVNITTAGVNTASPCYLAEKDAEKILDGLIENDAYFCIMYSADEGDDWASLVAQQKANPNLGVSVFPEYLEKQLNAARLSPQKQAIYKTKHLDLWTNALNGYFNMKDWEGCCDASLSLEQFLGEQCWMGVDLAAKIDLCSRIRIFQRMLPSENDVEVRHYYVFGQHYAPMDRINDGEHQHYLRWYEDGFLTGIPGAEIHLPTVQSDIESDLDEYEMQRLAFDPWQATQMQQDIASKLSDDVVITVPQQVQYLSPAMKELDAAIRAGRVHHSGDPVLTWAMSCVVARVDAKDNVFPRKIENGKDKIDPAVALITGINQAMLGEVKRKYTVPMIGVL